MSTTRRFLVVRKNNLNGNYYQVDNLSGYNLKLKKDIHFSDAIDFRNIMIINTQFIESIASKKIKSKFDRLINMMQIVCEVGDEDESGEGYRIALNEANKLKMELWNKYKKFISDEKIELMIKKIEILEDELNLRLDLLLNAQLMNEEMEKGHSR